MGSVNFILGIWGKMYHVHKFFCVLFRCMLVMKVTHRCVKSHSAYLSNFSLIHTFIQNPNCGMSARLCCHCQCYCLAQMFALDACYNQAA
jgi:hypothetical protein